MLANWLGVLVILFIPDVKLLANWFGVLAILLMPDLTLSRVFIPEVKLLAVLVKLFPIWFNPVPNPTGLFRLFSPLLIPDNPVFNPVFNPGTLVLIPGRPAFWG